MKVLVIPDSFKDSITATEFNQLFSQVLSERKANWDVISIPMADGGEGTLEYLKRYLDLKDVEIETYDPLFRKINTSYLSDGKNAFIVLAKMLGIELLKPSERRCMYASSFGLGQAIADALIQGHKEIHLFIGGSATQDCGIGMAEALGYRFYSKSGQLQQVRSKDLEKLIDVSNPDQENLLGNCEFTCHTDVDNILMGPTGAAWTYAEQKGATASDIKILEEGARNLVSLMNKNAKGIATKKGAGAAGGIGFGAACFLGAKLINSADLLFRIAKVKEWIENVDLIITGEGKLDTQSFQGKHISRIIDLAKQFKKPVIVFCALSEFDDKAFIDLGGKMIYRLYDQNPETISIQNTTNRLRAAFNKFIENWKR